MALFMNGDLVCCAWVWGGKFETQCEIGFKDERGRERGGTWSECCLACNGELICSFKATVWFWVFFKCSNTIEKILWHYQICSFCNVEFIVFKLNEWRHSTIPYRRILLCVESNCHSEVCVWYTYRSLLPEYISVFLNVANNEKKSFKRGKRALS